MQDVIFGYSGLVGSYITDAYPNSLMLNSKNSIDAAGKSFGRAFISAMPAEKWRANKFPEQDEKTLENLKSSISKSNPEEVLLISTVDVFSNPVAVDENSVPEKKSLHTYGLNRLLFENWVVDRFPKTWIVRLPGLVSERLKKNALYDLKHEGKSNVPNNASFQFYPLERLVTDLEVVMSSPYGIYHLTSAPISMQELVVAGNIKEDQLGLAVENSAAYDFKTINAGLWGLDSSYQVSKSESLSAIEKYLRK